MARWTLTGSYIALIDGKQGLIVAVGAQGVGYFNGILIALQGMGCLVLVAVDAAQQIVGLQPFVGGAVAVEVAVGKSWQAVTTVMDSIHNRNAMDCVSYRHLCCIVYLERTFFGFSVQKYILNM